MWHSPGLSLIAYVLVSFLPDNRPFLVALLIGAMMHLSFLGELRVVVLTQIQ